MRIYLQGFSALEHYRSISARLSMQRQPMDVRRLEGATSSLRELDSLTISLIGVDEPTKEHPLEVLVPHPNLRNRSVMVHARVWKGLVPDNGLRKIRKDVFVSSPEFVFLQLATKLDFCSLVALGMEFCGTYRRNIPVKHIDSDEVSYTTDYDQPTLTTPKRLRGLLKAIKSAPGSSVALRALDFVLPNSASPMETAVYLLLCLPRRVGGYALPAPALNVAKTLTDSARRFTWRSAAKPDLYWKKAKLDLEYNSSEYHDETKRAEDSMRRKALEEMGIEVIELTPEEVFSEERFHAIALRIARRLGKRIRSQYEGNFVLRRSELRELLLHDDDDRSGVSSIEQRRLLDSDELTYVPVDDEGNELGAW